MKNQIFLLLLMISIIGCGNKEVSKIFVEDLSSAGGGGAIENSTAISTRMLAPSKECEFGGVTINSGIDENGNGLLDTEEIDVTKIVCNGNSGFNSLIKIHDESPGISCSSGGKKIITGLDKNRNNELEDDEIEDIQYVCNGTNGTNGVDNRATGAIFCQGSLEGFSGVSWNYDIKILSSGDLIVQSAIYDSLIAVSKTNYYADDQVGSSTAAVIFSFDLIGSANGGFWNISLERNTLNTQIQYFDTDLINNPTTWVFSASNCLVQDFTN